MSLAVPSAGVSRRKACARAYAASASAKLVEAAEVISSPLLVRARPNYVDASKAALTPKQDKEFGGG